jgi:hypothetical protein
MVEMGDGVVGTLGKTGEFGPVSHRAASDAKHDGRLGAVRSVESIFHRSSPSDVDVL